MSDRGASYQQAIELYQQGNLQGAELICERLLQKNRNDVPALELSAGIALQQGNAQKAAGFLLRQVKLQPRNAIVHSNLGMALHESGRSDEACHHCRRAIALQPDLAQAYNNLGNIYKARSNLQDALSNYEKALELGAEDPRIYVNAGLVSQLLGDLQKAEQRYREVLGRFPDFAPAHNNLGAVLQKLECYQEAEAHFSRAIALQPNDPTAHSNMGGLWLAQGAIEKAKECFEKSIQLNPGSIEALANLGLLYDELGDMECSREYYAKAFSLGLGDSIVDADMKLDLGRQLGRLEERSHNLDEAEHLVAELEGLGIRSPALLLFKARLCGRQKDFQGALELLRMIDDEAFEDKRFHADYLFELGSVLDKLSDYPQAFAAYEKANSLKNSYLNAVYDEAEDQRRLEVVREFWSRENWDRLRVVSQEAGLERPRPIFIVGFPRSGTSLLEQMLGSHPLIAPAGELGFVGSLEQDRCKVILGSSKDYPECLLDVDAPLDQDRLASFRGYYLSGVAELGVLDETAQWVTDKMPHNLMSLGLIRLMFPGSPIIHISRHPLDSCLSAFFSNLRWQHRYTSSLEATAKHYVRAMACLEHYKRVLDMRFVEVRYQDLVDDREAVVRKLLEFIGAPWDERCLQHHKSKRVVKTASYEQVTQKVYRSSLARYRNYWDEVQPIIPILESTIKRYGYSLD